MTIEPAVQSRARAISKQSGSRAEAGAELGGGGARPPHRDAVVSCGQFWFLGQIVALRRNQRACEFQAVSSYKTSPLTWYFLEVTSGMRRISTASRHEEQHPAQESGLRRVHIAPPACLHEPLTPTSRFGRRAPPSARWLCNAAAPLASGKRSSSCLSRRSTKARRVLARAKDGMQTADEDQALQQLLSDPRSSS